MTSIIQGMASKETIVIIFVAIIIVAIIALTLAGDHKEAKKVIRTAITVLSIILLIYILYEVYEYYRKIKKNEPLLFDGPASGKAAQHFPATHLPPSSIGSEYTYSFWIYVNGWDYKYDHPKHILSRGDNPSQHFINEPFKCNPGIWLYPKTSNLMIRFDTYNREDNFSYKPNEKMTGSPIKGDTSNYEDTTLQGCKQKCLTNQTCQGFMVDKQSGQCVLRDSSVSTKQGGSGYDSYVRTPSMDPTVLNTDHITPNEICDLVELPIQRWVHVGVVLWNRTTDIYLNGKLVRSCILKGIPKVPWKDNLYVAADGGFDGSMAQLRYFNRALNATEMYKLYSKGPLHWSLLKSFEDIFPKVHVAASVSYSDNSAHHSHH
jgi:hypothetical protein